MILMLSAVTSLSLGQVPHGPPVWQMNLSTIIMPCNYTGWTDPASTKGWGTVDLIGVTVKAREMRTAGQSTHQWTVRKCLRRK